MIIDEESVLLSDARERRAAARRAVEALAALRALSSELQPLEGERGLVRTVADFLLERLAADRVLVALAPSRPGDGLAVAAVRTRAFPPPGLRQGEEADTRLRAAVLARTTISGAAAGAPSLVAVPLIARGRVLGAIEVERACAARGALDDVDVLVAEIAADLLAGRLDAARR